MSETLCRVLVQTSRNDGLSQVLSDLLTFDGSELYFSNIPSLEGVLFGNVQSVLYDAVAVGFQRGKEVFLNPKSDEKMQKDDMLLVLSASGTSYRIGEPRIVELCDTEQKFEFKDTRQKEVLCILGSNSKSLDLVLREYDEYMLAGSKIFLLPLQDNGYIVPENLENITVEVLPGSSVDPSSLKDIPLEMLDSVIIMSSDSVSFTDSDAQTITSTLLLRQLTAKMANPPPIIVEILDVESRELLDQRSLGVNFVLSSEITSRLISQISLDAGLHLVFDELFSAEGKEIYLKDHLFYTRGQRVSWLEVQKRAASVNEVAIGYYGSATSTLNPPQDEYRLYLPGDKVVVISEDDSEYMLLE